MDVTHILEPLNDAQREAVTANGHVLVLAGAGSGKTRVLVHRITWTLATDQASPFRILAVTFTNKAAGEMRARIEAMIERPIGSMWVGTFHGLAHRLLRTHWSDSGLPEGFQILDSDDQLRCIRRVLKDLDLDESRWAPRQAQGYINARKDEGLRGEHIVAHGDFWVEQMLRIYIAYEEACERSGVVDFAELLLRAHELLRDRADILSLYQERFSHIHVDEFQDTNAIQYAWLKLLAGDSSRMFVVGDDDQSIYGWRGARIENIHQFTKDFPEVATLRLEQNYRSTATILSGANAVIANNVGRMGKNLWTEGERGEPILLYGAYNDLDEARYVVASIQQWIENGGARDEVAILYRVSAQSRVLEEALLTSGIPYRVYGGLRFYERAEIKHTLAYLRLVANRDDDPAFERVVNMPARGVGARTLEVIRLSARERQVSLWSAARELLTKANLSARAGNALRGFLELIDDLDESASGLPLEESVSATLDVSGLIAHFKQQKVDRTQTRVENLEELVTAARQFAEHQVEEGEPLIQFLAHAALESGDQEADSWEKSVNLMTLHASKGLEFAAVYLCGLEDGLFPHQRSLDKPDSLEEERRLCYVGMTRAGKQLVLSYAESRRLHGSDHYPSPSRFLKEIPPELIQRVRLGGKISRPAYTRTERSPTGNADDTPQGGYRLGQRVEHPKFGEGVVLTYEGQGSHARVQVNFQDVGSKWLVIAYANLQSI